MSSETIEARIRVAVRVRPRVESLGERYELVCTRKMDSENLKIIHPTDQSYLSRKHDYCFNYVFDETDTQLDIYREAVGDMLDPLLDGYHVTIIAYGQTGSGKTYTILGDSTQRGDTSLCEGSGIFLRLLTDIFAFGAATKGKVSLKVSIAVMEVYLEKVRDLLNERKEVDMHQVNASEEDIPDLTWKPVSSIPDAVSYFELAVSQRSTASTQSNHSSSRSHAILIFNLEQTSVDSKGEKRTVNSRVTLCDLAGSERVAKSKVEGMQMKEAQFINTSLSTLGKVVNGMYEGSAHIPYRDSKLTRILRHGLASQDCRVLLITNVSPTAASFTESCSSLRFADRVKSLKTTITVAVDAAAEQAYLEALKKLEESAAELRVAFAQHFMLPSRFVLPLRCGLVAPTRYDREDRLAGVRGYVEKKLKAEAAVLEAKRQQRFDSLVNSATLSDEARANIRIIDGLNGQLAQLDDEAAAADAKVAERKSDVKARIAELKQARRDLVESTTNRVRDLRDQLAASQGEKEELSGTLIEKLTAVGFGEQCQFTGESFNEMWHQFRLPTTCPLISEAFPRSKSKSAPAPSPPRPNLESRDMMLECVMEGGGDEFSPTRNEIPSRDVLRTEGRRKEEIPSPIGSDEEVAGRSTRRRSASFRRLSKPAAVDTIKSGGLVTENVKAYQEHESRTLLETYDLDEIDDVVVKIKALPDSGTVDRDTLESIIRIMDQYDCVVPVQTSAMGRLALLLESDSSNRTILAELNCAARVLRSARMFPWKAVLQTRSITALLHLSRRDPDQVIARLGGIPFIVHNMRRFPEDIALLGVSCLTLWSLATNKDLKVVIAVYEGVAEIINVMRRFPTEVEVLQPACAALASLAANPSNQALIAQLDGIGCLVQAIATHLSREHFRLLSRGLSALSTLALRERNKILIAQANGVAYVIHAMKLFPDQPELLGRGNAALCNLAAHSETIQKIAELGGVEVVISSMKMYSANAELMTSGAVAISNLAVYAPNSIRVMELGGHTLVLNGMRQFPKHNDLNRRSIAALCTLGLLAQHRRVLKDAGAIELVIAGMKSFSDCPALLFKACTALWNFSRDPAVKSHIEALNARALVEKIIIDFASSEDLVNEARGFLDDKNFDDEHGVDKLSASGTTIGTGGGGAFMTTIGTSGTTVGGPAATSIGSPAYKSGDAKKRGGILSGLLKRK